MRTTITVSMDKSDTLSPKARVALTDYVASYGTVANMRCRDGTLSRCSFAFQEDKRIISICIDLRGSIFRLIYSITLHSGVNRGAKSNARTLPSERKLASARGQKKERHIVPAGAALRAAA
jgi:hypothetical protein